MQHRLVGHVGAVRREAALGKGDLPFLGQDVVYQQLGAVRTGRLLGDAHTARQDGRAVADHAPAHNGVGLRVFGQHRDEGDEEALGILARDGRIYHIARRGTGGHVGLAECLQNLPAVLAVLLDPEPIDGEARGVLLGVICRQLALEWAGVLLDRRRQVRDSLGRFLHQRLVPDEYHRVARHGVDAGRELRPGWHLVVLNRLVGHQLALGDEVLPGVRGRGDDDVGGASVAGGLRVVALKDLVGTEVERLELDPGIFSSKAFNHGRPVLLAHDGVDDQAVGLFLGVLDHLGVVRGGSRSTGRGGRGWFGSFRRFRGFGRLGRRGGGGRGGLGGLGGWLGRIRRLGGRGRCLTRAAAGRHEEREANDKETQEQDGTPLTMGLGLIHHWGFSSYAGWVTEGSEFDSNIFETDEIYKRQISHHGSTLA